MSTLSVFCERCNKFRKRHCNGDRNTCMSILFDIIEALRKENILLDYLHRKEESDHAKTLKQLAKYKDSGLSPEEVQELAKAKADGRLKILPAKPGDIIYRPEALQFCWVITKVEIYEDEIVFIDDSDNIFRPDDIGKTVFLTKEAEKALGCGEP